MSVRSSMLELAILGELTGPLHGYEIRRRLAQTLGPWRRLSFGSLYPALHRLEAAGLIEVVTRSGQPRKKKQVTYALTSAGATFLANSLATAAVDDDSLPLTMGLMSQATPAVRLQLLKQRRTQVLERQTAHSLASASKDFWLRSKAELDSRQAQQELDWLDRLIATISGKDPNSGPFPDTPNVKNG